MPTVPRIAALVSALAASLGVVASADAAGAIKAAYTETVIPARTFHDVLSTGNGNYDYSAGATGVLGVTSLTLTNYDSSPQRVSIASPTSFVGPSCGSTPLTVGQVLVEVWIQPRSTLHLPFPTPLVFQPLADGKACVAVKVQTALHDGSVGTSIIGVVN